MKLLLSKNKIHNFSVHSPLIASVGIRFNRTLREKMWKYFPEVNNHCCIVVIDREMINFNNLHHRSIKMTPIEERNKKNARKVRKNLYTKINQHSRKHKYRIKDLVRINRYKNIFDKGYLQNYRTEIFRICKVRNTIPITYRIKDYIDEITEVIFYENELVGYKKKDKIYKVEKIFRKNKIKGHYKYVVK